MASGDEIDLQPGTQPFLPKGTNKLFVRLVNDSTRQGLQLDLTYDPRVLQVQSVAPLGRLQSPLQLYYSDTPRPQGPWRSWPSVATLHLLAYDGSASRTSIAADTNSVVLVSFAVRDTVPSDSAYISVGDALVANEALARIPIAPQTIAIPLEAVTGTLVSMFTASSIGGGQVRIQWELSSPRLAVNVYRSFIDDPARTKINDASIGGPGEHVLFDTPPTRTGTLVYGLVASGPGGNSDIARLELLWGDVPLRFALYPTTPNPFSSSTLIRFDVPRKGRVQIALYDIAGRLVRTLQNDEMPAGRYSRSWDGRTSNGEALSSGVYFCVGQFGRDRMVRPVIRLR